MGIMTVSITSGTMSLGKTRTTIVTSERTEKTEGRIPNNISSIRNAGLRTRMTSTIVRNMIRGSRNQEEKTSDTTDSMSASMREGIPRMIGRM